MDFTLFMVIIGTGAAIIAINVALFSMLLTMMTKFETKLSSDMKTFEGEIRGWKDEIYKEMKDFHGRLCNLEGRRQDRTDP